jgi:hypothetical protein
MPDAPIFRVDLEKITQFTIPYTPLAIFVPIRTGYKGMEDKFQDGITLGSSLHGKHVWAAGYYAGCIFAFGYFF